MFIIAIPKNDIPLLNGDGCNVTINGQSTVLRREGEYLCYAENRCKILDEHVNGENVEFSAASHGAEDEPHFIFRPDEIEIEVGKEQLLALAKAENKLREAGSDFAAVSDRLHGDSRAFVSTIAGLIDGLVTAIDDEMRQVD